MTSRPVGQKGHRFLVVYSSPLPSIHAFLIFDVA